MGIARHFVPVDLTSEQFVWCLLIGLIIICAINIRVRYLEKKENEERIRKRYKKNYKGK